jgi:hypothetical protein
MMSSNQTNVYTKIVDEREFVFTLIASNENISPKLISWKRDNSKYIIQIEKFPNTLMHITNHGLYKKDRGIYKDKITKLVTKLHSLVINPITIDVKLIDFGISCWIDDIPDIIFKNAYAYIEPAVSVDHLLELEIEQISKIIKCCPPHKMINHPILPILYCKYGCEHVQRLDCEHFQILNK